LATLQLVLIEAGEGEFESRTVPLHAVTPGDVLLLPPRSWHRYRPRQAMGWTEVWMELEGPVIEQLERAGTFGREARVVRPASWKTLHGTWREIHARLTGDDVSTHDPERGALGLRALALVTEQLSRTDTTDPASVWVRVAEQRLAADLRDPPGVEQLARELGVSYTHFRREFRRITGLAPHRYLARLRLMQARRMLGSSSLTLEMMAERLGYSSAFHLSAAFKREFGESPRAWRRRLHATN
jgi:AraC-like DNA-binding protein